MEKTTKVGISDYKIARSPEQLITLGLGSCVGIAIYDERNKVGGLSHIMLPDSRSFKDRIEVAKFADLAIPAMVEEIKGLNRSARLVAKIAGGASMFDFGNKSEKSIGLRNVEAVEEVLKKLKIPILGKDTGGNIGRTMLLNLDTAQVSVRKVKGEYELI